MNHRSQSESGRTPSTEDLAGNNVPLTHGVLAKPQQGARTGVWFCNLTKRQPMWWSDELYHILGLEPDVAAPSVETFLAVVHADDRAEIERRALPRRRDQSEAEPFDFRIVLRDGRTRHARLTSVVTDAVAEACVCWIGSIVDFTDSIRAATLLAQTNEELAIAQRVARMGSYTLDVARMRSKWSPSLFELLDIDPTEAPNPELFFSRVHPEDMEVARSTLEQIIKTEIGAAVELRMQRRDGSLWYAYADSRPQRASDGRLLLRGVVQDITLRKAEDERRGQADKMVAIGTLAGGVAHDFNNYLAVLMGELELLRAMLPPDQRVKRSLDAVHSAAERCAKLTSQLLSIGRKRQVRVECFDVCKLMERISPMLHSIFSEGRELVVETSCEPMMVCADPVELEHALLNLALNARDAMPDGGRFALTARLEERNDAQTGEKLRWAQIDASDTGAGMDAATRARVFEPFFSTKGVGKGAGLGLATVYSAMQHAGGHAHVESELGRGTTFRLSLPTAKQSEPGQSEAEIKSGQGEEVRRTILVVEDVPALRSVICRQLVEAGYEVEAAEHGRAALDLLAQGKKRFDAVLSDVVMPVLGGFELERALREHYPHIPCVLMTGYAEHELTELRSRIALRKPFKIEQLHAVFDRLWGNEPSKAGATPS